MTEKTEKEDIKPEDPIRELILNAVSEGNIVSPRDLAIILADERGTEKDPADYWRKFLMPLKQQAKSLARQGKISIMRRGKPIDPNKMKGLIKFGPKVDGAEISEHESEYVRQKDEK